MSSNTLNFHTSGVRCYSRHACAHTRICHACTDSDIAAPPISFQNNDDSSAVTACTDSDIAAPPIHFQNDDDSSAVTVALNARHQTSMQALTSGTLLRPFEDIISLIIDHPKFNASEANCPSYVNTRISSSCCHSTHQGCHLRPVPHTASVATECTIIICARPPLCMSS
jgi:hypothetical protein